MHAILLVCLIVPGCVVITCGDFPVLLVGCLIVTAAAMKLRHDAAAVAVTAWIGVWMDERMDRCMA